MFEGLELRSLITADGMLRISVEPVEIADPGPGEVVVEMEAAPLNPTDHYLMTGPADMSTLQTSGSAELPALTMTVPEAALPFVRQRLGQSLPVGTEGAGKVGAAGAGTEHLSGKRIASLAGGMFTQYRTLRSDQCVVLPETVSNEEGAALFVNPLTVLGFVETMRAEGHSALVHGAAASNLGQMLLKVCQADGIGLVNIVRRPEQVRLLRDLGAAHVVDSSAPEFEQKLAAAVAETGARMGFDPTGGGVLASQMLTAMEAASVAGDAGYQRYGSGAPKTVYIYGGLERGPTVLNRSFGFAWTLGGWLLFNFLQRAGDATRERLIARVLKEATTTFASHYTRRISLKEILDPEIFRAFQAKSTGEKYLVRPNAG